MPHARADIESALANAREIGHAVTLMYALTNAAALHMHWGNYQAAISFDNELAVLAEQTDAPFWKAGGIGHRGCIFSLTGESWAAVDAITSAGHGMAFNGSNNLDDDVPAPFGQSLRRKR